MILLSLLKAASDRLQARAREHLAYQQLRHLPPYLLDDIGVRLQRGRVISLNAEHSAVNPPERQRVPTIPAGRSSAGEYQGAATVSGCPPDQLQTRPAVP